VWRLNPGFFWGEKDSLKYCLQTKRIIRIEKKSGEDNVAKERGGRGWVFGVNPKFN
jgi:hypothetical protein